MQNIKPSQEKRFLKYYNKDAINSTVKDMKIIDYMKENNLGDHINENAVTYYGNTLTYKEFFELIDTAVRAFKALGIEKGEFVPISSPNFIDGLVSFYALNSIGAIPNMITPMASSEEFFYYLSEAPVKNVIIFDESYGKFRDVLKKANIKNTILVSPKTYLPKNLKVMKSVSDFMKGNVNKIKKSLQDSNNPIYFDKALLMYAKEYLGDVSSADYNFDDTAVILHTGGTTGFPKAVLATNNNFNAMVHQYESTIDTIKRGDNIVTVLPMNIGFGLCNNMHMPLRMGVNLVLHPTFNPMDIYPLFKKYNPSTFMAIAPYFKGMMKDKRFDNIKLSNLKEVCYGGEAMTFEEIKQFNEWLMNHGADTVIKNGYGMNELISSAAYEHYVGDGQYRTIPLVNSNIKIVKVDFDKEGNVIRSDVELNRGEEGEICLTSPTLSKGYLNNKEATDEIFRVHSDGIRWIHTGDYGKIDEYDGLHHLGRMKRIHLTIGDDGAPIKFFPDLIEDCIMETEGVEDVAVVGIPDDEKSSVPVAYVVSNLSEDDEMRERINEQCQKISAYSRPVEIYFVDRLPQTAIGKTDILKLEKDAVIRRNQKDSVKIKKL